MSETQACVVLGGSGFLGQRLCERLVGEGFRVLSVSRSGAPAPVHDPWYSKVEWVAAPLGSDTSIKVVESSDLLFHLSSTTVPLTSNSHIRFDLESNLLAAVRLLEVAAASKIRRVVFVSSGGTVYGVPRQNPIDETHPTDPICSYGIQKLAIEKYLQLFHSMAGLDYIILRVSNMYGESQSSQGQVGAVAHFMDNAIHGRPVEIWGDGSIIRDYIHVDDVVNALVASVNYGGGERIFNIGTGRGVSLNQLVDLIRARIEQQVTAVYKPSRSFDVLQNVLNVNKARQELMWRSSISLEAGLERMIGKVCVKDGCAQKAG
jgi:UDP-glucose 4-epimerase